jgi:hypothetical protein
MLLFRHSLLVALFHATIYQRKSSTLTWPELWYSIYDLQWAEDHSPTPCTSDTELGQNAGIKTLKCAVNKGNRVPCRLKCNYSKTWFNRTLVVQIANYPDLLGPSGIFVDNSTKPTCLEITSYRIKYSTVLWLLELQIRGGQKVQTQVHTANSNSLISNYQCRLFLKRKFQLSGFSAYLDDWAFQLIRISGVILYIFPCRNTPQLDRTSALSTLYDHQTHHRQ